MYLKLVLIEYVFLKLVFIKILINSFENNVIYKRTVLRENIQLNIEDHNHLCHICGMVYQGIHLFLDLKVELIYYLIAIRFDM